MCFFEVIERERERGGREEKGKAAVDGRREC